MTKTALNGQSSFRIEGLVAAVFTPLHPDGSLNLGLIAPIVERLLGQGVGALYVCGATGEGPHLTDDERMAVAEAYLHAAAGRARIIVQVGHSSLRAAAQLAAHAARSGADAISATPPLFFRVHSEEALLDSLAEICAGAPGLPLYYYHIPRLTGVPIDVLRFLTLAIQRLPALAGVKYSDFKIFELQACAELAGGRFHMLFGSDEMLLSGLVGGAQGAVGTTYSFAAPLYLRLLEAFRKGDLLAAQHLQSLSVQMVQVINRYAPPTTNLPPMKAVMALLDLDCGPLRLPLPTLTVDQMKALRHDLHEIGFFDWGL